MAVWDGQRDTLEKKVTTFPYFTIAMISLMASLFSSCQGPPPDWEAGLGFLGTKPLRKAQERTVMEQQLSWASLEQKNLYP